MTNIHTCKVDLSSLVDPPKYMSLMAFFIHMFEYSVDKMIKEYGNELFKQESNYLDDFLMNLERNPNIQVKEVFDFVDSLVDRGIIDKDLVEYCFEYPRFDKHINLSEECNEFYRKYGTNNGRFNLLAAIDNNRRRYANVHSVLDIIFIYNYYSGTSNTLSWYNANYDDYDPYLDCDKVKEIIDNVGCKCVYDIDTSDTATYSAYTATYSKHCNIIYNNMYKLHLSPVTNWSDIRDLSLTYRQKLPQCDRDDYDREILLESPKLTRSIIYNDDSLRKYFDKDHHIPFDEYLYKLVDFNDIVNEFTANKYNSYQMITSCYNITFELTELLIKRSTCTIDDENGKYYDKYMTDYSNPYIYQLELIERYKKEVLIALPYVITIQKWWRDVSYDNPRRWLAKSKLIAIITSYY